MKHRWKFGATLLCFLCILGIDRFVRTYVTLNVPPNQQPKSSSGPPEKTHLISTMYRDGQTKIDISHDTQADFQAPGKEVRVPPKVTAIKYRVSTMAKKMLKLEMRLRAHSILNWKLQLQREANLSNEGENSRFLQKLRKVSFDQEGSENRCVIRVLQMCDRFCKTIRKPNTNSSDGWMDFECGRTACTIQTKTSVNLTDFLSSDVVIFFPTVHRWKQWVANRPPGQLWVLHSKESPSHWRRLAPPRELGNPLNLSLTYMSDSDITHPYLYYVQKESDENLPPLQKKTKLMAWVSSNCFNISWDRGKLVQTLKKYLPVDDYGKCGSLTCAKNNSACSNLTSEYKFYLALENSQCPEYITEKFWGNALYDGSVPIVYGAPKADYTRLAPPNSFIHLDDFASVQEFKDYIEMLDNNDTLYMKYFEWRASGTLHRGTTLISLRRLGPPHVCYILTVLLDKSFNPSKYPWRDNHPNFYDWWNGMCHEKKRVMGINV